jgi:hypothetical protein
MRSGTGTHAARLHLNTIFCSRVHAGWHQSVPRVQLNLVSFPVPT